MSVGTSGSQPPGQASATAALLGYAAASSVENSFISSSVSGDSQSLGDEHHQSFGRSQHPSTSEMVLQLVDTLVVQEPFCADYPSYYEAEPLTHSHNQSSSSHSPQQSNHNQYSHHHHLPRSINGSGMPSSVSPDPNTHTPGKNKCSYVRHRHSKVTVALYTATLIRSSKCAVQSCGVKSLYGSSYPTGVK